MDDMNSTVFPEIPDKNRPYKLLELTSASYDFPSFAMLNPSLCDRIALMLYYAHVMDQKKVLNDFYKLYFKNVAQSSSSESSINAWIKNAIFKLNRRQEVISSETVSTLQNQIVFAISQVVFDVLWDFLVDVDKKGLISGVNARPKRQCSTKSNYLFPNMEMLLPNATCLNFAPFLPVKENIKLSVSMSDPLHCLRNFWLEFCYHPDPMQNVKFVQHFHEEPETSSTQQFNDDSETNSTFSSSSSDAQSKAPNSMQQFSADPKKSNLMLQSADDGKTTHTTTILQNNHIVDNTNSSQHSDQSTISSESDSDSSGSWSCNDFNDSMSDDDHLCSYTSNNRFLEKCNATIDWLQSTACDFDSDDDNLNFSQVLTEENCMGSPSRGSLNFVDCSDEEDDYEVIFFDGSSDTGFENDAFMDMSQGFENPCFEDSYRVFPAPSFIEMVNECWNDDMMELQDKPRKPSKVSFAPEPSLVTVQYFEKTDENTFDASLVLDNLRFRKRVTELGHLLSPFLTIEHRMVVQKRNCFCELD